MTTKKYKAFCSNCGDCRGHKTKANIDGLCRSCASLKRFGNLESTRDRNKVHWQHRQADAHIKQIKRFRSQLNKSINNDNKLKVLLKNLDYDIIQLKSSLSDQFFPHPTTHEPMTWSNHGQWYIDYCISLSNLELTTQEQFNKICHYTNLRPIWK